MNRTIYVATGHTLHVSTIELDSIPLAIRTKNADVIENFDSFYVVRNWDKSGIVFMYLAKGHINGPTEICAFYRAGGFWSGFGKTLKTAIEGAQRDGWLYA